MFVLAESSQIRIGRLANIWLTLMPVLYKDS